MATELSTGLLVLSADPVSPTRITIPRPGSVPRPHLVARLEAGTRSRLTALSAPGGWGKTSILAEWALSTDMPVAWLTLDHHDNDPTRYFRSLTAALERVNPLYFDDPLGERSVTGHAISGQIAGVVLARLADVESDTAIVIDDVHLLVNPDLIQALREVVEALPPVIHLVLSSRQELPFPVARLRSRGELTMLRSEDLAFTEIDARAKIEDMVGSPLADDDIALLVERTEGWIAGLHLAGLSLASSRDRGQAIEHLRGTHRNLSDYFQEEVLAFLDDDLRQFLIESAIPDRFCAELLDVMTGRSDARAMIQRVADANLFLVPLDDERRWYRHHALFRDVLASELGHLPSERLAMLHRRASTWFERDVLVREAVTHAIAAGDQDRVADLVDTYAPVLMYVCGETNALVSWIDEIGIDEVRRRPRLLWAQAWALTTSGRVDQAQVLLDRYGELGLTTAPDAEALMLAVRSRLAAYRGDNRAAIEFGERSLAMLDPTLHGQTQGDVVLSMGFAHRSLGQSSKAAARFAEAARLGRTYGNVQAARWGVRYLAVTRMSEGSLTEAEALLDEDLDRVRRESADPGNILSALLVGKAEIHYLRNELDSAHAALGQAIRLIQGMGDAKMLSNAYAILGKVLQAQGDAEGATDYIRRSESVFALLVPGANVALLALAQGKLASALRWATQSGFTLADQPDASRGEFEQETYARIMLAAEPGPASFALIDRLIADADITARFGRSLDMHLARAVAAQTTGHEHEARHSLVVAIRHARDERIIRPFLNNGAPMHSLLRDFVRRRDQLDPRDRQFALSLIASFGLVESEPGNADPLLEPLTDRQRDILQLLADGHANREIAKHLSIAEGTVKAHLNQVFGKLGARNRTEAVATARQLGMLS